MTNSFFWYDVMTTDTAACLAFYKDVVGWGSEDTAPGMDYTLLTVDGMGVAGVMPIPEHARGVPPCWMGYIHVEDIDAKVAELTAAGGALHRGPFEVPGIIKIAVVADPQGGGFMLGQPLPTQARPMPAPGATGTFGWHELFAADWKAVFPFYEKLFGWVLSDSFDMGPMGTYQLFTVDDQPVGGLMNKPADMPVAFWNYYATVPSVTAAVARIAAGGGKVAMGPHEVPGGQWIVQGFDPQGAFFSLVSNEK